MKANTALRLIAISVLSLMMGCGSGNLGEASSNGPAPLPQIASSVPKVVQVDRAFTRDEIKELQEQQVSMLLEAAPIRPLTESATLLPFRATGVFGAPGTGFAFAYVDQDNTHREVFGRFLSDWVTPSSFGTKSADGYAIHPYTDMIGSVVNGSPGALSEDGFSLSLNSLDNQGPSYSVSSIEPPTGVNITFLENTVYNQTGPNTVIGRVYALVANLKNGWKVGAARSRYVYYNDPERESSSIRIDFIPPPPEWISITDGNYVESSKTLNFEITTGNSTLKDWSVDLQQNNTTVRSFAPTTDTRGPGVLSGVNPYNVSLTWDGLNASSNPVSGNVTWVLTARTTNYVGGPVNDGVRSAQAKLDASLASPFATVKKLSSSIVTMVDVKNEAYTLPQYDVDQNKKQPILIPIKGPFPGLDVYIDVILPPDDDPQAYFLWGEASNGERLFNTSSTLANGLNRVFFPMNADKIALYPKLKWYALPKSGGDVISMGTTDSPLYVTLDMPGKPQDRPRVDVVDFAVDAQKANPKSRNHVQIATYLTTKIWKDSGYFYHPFGDAQHTRFEDDNPNKVILQVSNFIDFPGNRVNPVGNCDDFSNLYQACGAALGAKDFETRRIVGPFDFYPVTPPSNPGQIESEGQLVYHQIGWLRGEDRVFDPTYFLIHGPRGTQQAKNVLLVDYETDLKNDDKASRKGRTNTWLPQEPIKVMRVW